MYQFISKLKIWHQIETLPSVLEYYIHGINFFMQTFTLSIINIWHYRPNMIYLRFQNRSKNHPLVCNNVQEKQSEICCLHTSTYSIKKNQILIKMKLMIFFNLLNKILKSFLIQNMIEYCNKNYRLFK